MKKTGLCVGLYPKAVKLILSDEGSLKIDGQGPRKSIEMQSAKLIKEIETACDKDKAITCRLISR